MPSWDSVFLAAMTAHLLYLIRGSNEDMWVKDLGLGQCAR